MERITRKLNKESLTTKLTLIIIGLTAGSALLIPATYASFHPVTTGEIADNTIRSADISNSAGVQSVDIVNGQVASVDIVNDAIKPNMQREQGETSVNPNDSNFISVDCPQGTVVTGGGFVLDSDSPIIVTASYPIDSDTWQVEGFNHGSISKAMQGWVVCMGPMP